MAKPPSSAANSPSRGSAAEQMAYIAELKAWHGVKRNFMRLLELGS